MSFLSFHITTTRFFETHFPQRSEQQINACTDAAVDMHWNSSRLAKNEQDNDTTDTCAAGKLDLALFDAGGTGSGHNLAPHVVGAKGRAVQCMCVSPVSCMSSISFAMRKLGWEQEKWPKAFPRCTGDLCSSL